MSRTLTVGSHEISDLSPCYVIAEVGHNHQGSLEKAIELFHEAKRAGASAVKLQKRNNRGLYTRAMFDKPYDHENSFGPTYGKHREALEFGVDEYRELRQCADEIGLDFFATAFDIESADFLELLDMPAYKIASGDLKNTPLLKHVAAFQKPMFVSTGAAVLDDVRRAYETVAPINSRFCLMQCTAGYPAQWDELNLRVVTRYRELFPDVVIGLSSHDSGIAMAVAAYVLGARVIEKHFTLNRAMKGTDHAFSLEPVGLRKMVRDLSRISVAIGDGQKRMYPNEVEPGIKMGKKLVAARDLPAGHVLTRDDIALKSPGDGLPPYKLDTVLGRATLWPLAEDDDIALDCLVASADEQRVRAGR